MKFVSILVLFFGLLLAFAFAYLNLNEARLDVEEPIEPEQVLGASGLIGANTEIVVVGGDEYRFNWLQADPASVRLYANHTEKVNSSKFLEDNSCRALVNGGFYDEESSPIGLFIAENEQITNFRSNSLFDGIFSINTFDTPRITRQVPEDSLVSAVQTGPVLVENAEFSRLNLVRDKEARRVIAMVNGKNELYFGVVYNPDTVFSGPNLADMPEVLKQFEDKVGLGIADAINLDGGSASVFIADKIKLTEISPVGSFFCVK